MNLRPRQIVYLVTGVVVLWLLFLSRSAMLPFFLAAAFAYILNPLVQILTDHIRLPRVLAVGLIYVAIIALATTTIVDIGGNLTAQSEQFASEARALVQQTNEQISTLPGWLQPMAIDAFESAQASLTFSSHRIGTLLSGALNKTLSVLVFLVASFYFLKDGHSFIRSLLDLFPKHLSDELSEILEKINHALGNYLRGQLLLMFIMGVLTYIGLTIIGVRYALIIAVFTGLVDIIPYIGPVTAASVAMLAAYADQASRLNLEPTVELAIIALLYLILNQIEALFIAPQVMGRMTKIHPLLVMFAVLAGGHLFGIVGFIIAVPLVASLKVVFDHFAAKSHEKAL